MRRWLVVTDEEVHLRLAPKPNGFLWIVDITDETRPIPVATWRVPNDKPFDPDNWFGAHQPQEQVYPNDNRIFVTWFTAGLRVLDIGNPYAPSEVGCYVPYPGPGQARIHSNDVFLDADGLIYLIDRFNGLDILEWTPGSPRAVGSPDRKAGTKASQRQARKAPRQRRKRP